MTIPSVTVVLPTRNRDWLVVESLESVLSQDFEDLEVVVINDGSTDGTSRLLGHQRDDRVRVFHFRSSVGLPSALNFGVSQSRGSYIFLFGDRYVADPSCLSCLMDTFESWDGAAPLAATGPRIVAPEGTSAIHSSGSKVAYVGRFSGEIYHNFSLDFEGAVEVPFLHAYSLTTRSAMDMVGGFSSLYEGNHYRMETDVFFRMRSLGLALAYQPRAIIYSRTASVGGSRLPRAANAFFVIRNHAIFLLRTRPCSAIANLPCYVVALVTAPRLAARGKRLMI